MGLKELLGKDDGWRSGRTRLAGLSDNVEILTDRHGVPHIFAGNFEDLYFAQGYVHARERLWQLELNRRVGQGRLAEILGPSAVPADRFLRRIGLERLSDAHWALLEGESRGYLEAYAAGVNAGAAGQTPPEFRLLQIRAKPWRGVDSLLWSKVMALDMSSNWEMELLRARLIEAVGPEKADLLHLRDPQGLPSSSGGAVRGLQEGLAAEYQQAVGWLGQASFGRFSGSNAWAVAGSRSSDGKPLLACDPHVLVRLPSTWYEVHLQVGDWWCYGASLAGLPGLMMGQNAHVSWGITNAYVDCQDLAVEEIRGEQIRTATGFVNAEIRHEKILVKGKKPVTEEVWVGPNGPLLYRDAQGGLALRWTGFQYHEDTTVDAIFAINGSQTLSEVRGALSAWDCPCLNFIFATSAGDIGYQLAGHVPIRPKGSGLVPVPGHSPEYGWSGRVPWEEMPNRLNPECGFVVSANNAIADGDYPHFLTHDWMAGFRAERIEQLLTGCDKHSPDDFAKYQMDQLCLPGLRFARACRNLEPQGAREREALAQLLAWDGVASPDSLGAGVYEVLLLHVCREAYGALLGDDMRQLWLAGAHSPMAVMGPHGGRYVGFVLEALERNDERLLGGRSWSQVLLAALTTAAEVARPWGDLHTFQLQHPMGAVPALAKYFNGPTIPYGGDTDTLCQSAVIPHKAYAAESWAPSWRFVVPMGNSREGRSILPSGQSGWPGDPHYLDHFPAWREGRLHGSLVARGALEASRPRRLILEPRGR